jgi:hypothetical protein
MEKSNKEIARSIAEMVYDIQSEGDFFYEHLKDEYGIVDKFAEKVLADEDHKEVMTCQMSADILSDIIRDPKGFHIKHSSKDFEDGVGYHPDDLEYDGHMTDYVKQVYNDPDVRKKIMDEVHIEMPTKKFKVTAKFVTYATIEVDAICQDSAMEAAEHLDGANFITDDEDGDWSIESAKELK